ncbi:gamma-glutamylcyclotransferase [Robertmurraya massiliosenegalensis]|uniref:gamma-glutamylcyclotransferase n=1 Tax=Robertmurraya massiliosenegalensis TaxID=1287657 RepID=UPI0003161D0D|nr:gamma-glutamylcyclotransferase family protein [Robertmurraya massiliosenegalensis]
MKVFVYGTLRKHEENYALLESAVPIAEQAWTYGELFDTGYGYPAMKRSERGKVYGELYEVDLATLSKLDNLEDYEANREDNLYERVEAQIFTDKGMYSGLVYVEKQKGLCKERISHGDWKLHQLLNKKPEPIYYFAYGSCMDVERFEKAKVAHFFEKVVGACTLEGYSMKYLFTAQDGGRADIIEDGGVTEGILYEIPFQGLSYLFDREGFNLGWYRPTFVDVKIGERRMADVLTFYVYDKQPELAPPLHYAAEILRGSKGRVSQGYYQKLEEELVRLGCKL